MARPGLLVEIEGIDGSGKSVQADRLRARLEAAGRAVVALSFPRYGRSFFADLVERYLKGEFGQDPESVSPYLASLPYACDRWDASRTIRDDLSAGRVVVCNRYVSANMGHQGAKFDQPDRRAEFFRWVYRLEYEVFAVPKPDVQIWLDVPVEVSLELIRRRSGQAGGPPRDIHETAQHLRRARESYLHLCALYPEWVRIECCPEGNLLPPEAISAIIWGRVGSVLV